VVRCAAGPWPGRFPVSSDDRVPPGWPRPPCPVASVVGFLRATPATATATATAVERVDLGDDRVVLADHRTTLAYDVLVVATGATLVPGETDGLVGPGWMERVFAFYTLAGATALADALALVDEGRLVVNVVDMPIKCPVAPLEFCFLADWFFHRRCEGSTMVESPQPLTTFASGAPVP
jgi:NADPH-dependent 2,4-dienoyl-CoA reductase/sulfur reductase-like enzyme